MNKEITSVSLLLSYDWRAKLLVRLSNTGLFGVNELVQKAKQLEHYFFNGEHAHYAPQTPEEHLITAYKIRMAGIHLKSGCNDVDQIIEVIEESKPYLLNHLIEMVEGKSVDEVNDLLKDFQRLRITSDSIMLP